MESEARTIGIDIQKCDAEIDEFIHADMRDVKLLGAADVVICHYVLGGFNANAAGFQRAVENCADWLKPDGLFFTNLRKDLTSTDYLNGGSPYSLLRAMSKVETKEHAAQCHRMMAERCPHGKELNMRLAVRLDPVSWHNGSRLAKGVSQESILRDAGVDPARTHGDACGTRQVDEGRGAFAYRAAEGLEQAVLDCVTDRTQLRSALMSHILLFRSIGDKEPEFCGVLL